MSLTDKFLYNSYVLEVCTLMFTCMDNILINFHLIPIRPKKTYFHVIIHHILIITYIEVFSLQFHFSLQKLHSI